MVKTWMPIPLILLTLSAHAETQRREPSLFLEYERELKRSAETQKIDETAFKKLMAPITAVKPLTPPKIIIATEPLPQKPVVSDKDTIGADSTPFLVINKPTPAPNLCSDQKTAEAPAERKTIFKNIKSVKENLLAKAKEFLGTPYGFGDKDDSRTDCSGFTQQVYRQFGVSLPHSAAEQAQLGEKVELGDLQVGDLLFYRTYKSDPSHVAIYAGEGQIIHASYNSRKVQFDSIDKGYYKQRFLYAKRLAFNDTAGME
ncbi:MAG: NlpC/P60 family protein [Sulfuricurvum sp.]|jgi:cell wall-associated NlpC family hydrolase|uniref:C40 family peptidase n=1 Tax=Sulfuricurvum sp. TaxID=2025608 RepID=UPI0025EF301E|nr:C40 family peptidase [Sulfuricurvum sp.]MCK9372946.1 NlpC/P60 family protein [Sulfuricurvum sp.]